MPTLPGQSTQEMFGVRLGIPGMLGIQRERERQKEEREERSKEAKVHFTALLHLNKKWEREKSGGRLAMRLTLCTGIPI